MGHLNTQISKNKTDSEIVKAHAATLPSRKQMPFRNVARGLRAL